MAILEIVKVPDELLKKISKPVTAFDGLLHTLLDDMKETVKRAGGAGIAAVQVGYLMRACVVWLRGDEYLELINPEYLEGKRLKKGTEGCLSIPETFVRVARMQWVKFRAQDRYGRFFEVELKGLPAICAQHELDHMNGILIIDVAEVK